MLSMKPVGTVRSTRKKVTDDDWLRESVHIELNPGFQADALAGLTEFSHVEVLFFMDQVEPQKIEVSARHPRNNPEWPKIGIFAQRGKNRPNQIGLTVCEILKVEGSKLHLKGLDAVEGTPVLDIKPWMSEFGPRGPVRQPEWSRELMSDYWEPQRTDAKEPDAFDPVRLDTEHVKIRPLKAVSWQKLAQGLLYEGSFHAKSWGLKTPDDIKKMYENALVAWANKRGNPIVFLSSDETEVVGMTNFMNIEPSNKMLEIGGTWIGKKWQRSFVNTETKFALLQYAFEVLKLHRVEFRVDVDNLASQTAVRRLGFHFEGLMERRKINAQGDVRDYHLYSVTDLRWPAVKAYMSGLKDKSKTLVFEDVQKIKSLLLSGEHDAAFEAVQRALGRNPESAELNYLAASICDAHRTETEAVSFYLKALERGLQGEDRRHALLGLASTYRSLGRYDEAKELFETGLREFPHYRPYWVFLALTEFNLARSAEAVKILLDQLLETTGDHEIRSYQRAIRFYSTRLHEVFE